MSSIPALLSQTGKNPFSSPKASHQSGLSYGNVFSSHSTEAATPPKISDPFAEYWRAQVERDLKPNRFSIYA